MDRTAITVPAGKFCQISGRASWTDWRPRPSWRDDRTPESCTYGQLEQVAPYELNQIFFEELEIRPPDVYLDAAGATAAETIGQVIARSDAALRSVGDAENRRTERCATH
jgi:hypothetical protein